MKKRVLALILALVMALSLLPMMVAAEGEAQAILSVQEATAKAIELINAANPSQAVLTIKSLEAFEKAADGKATKIIIPSEIQGIAGLSSALKGIVTDGSN